MGTYNLPRNVKGEGRILIFSYKALIYTAVGVFVGYLISLIFKIIGLAIVGYIVMGILGLIGFIIGTFKMPESNAFEITKQTGGENIDDIIKRAIKFKMNKNKIYIYKYEEKELDEEDGGEDK